LSLAIVIALIGFTVGPAIVTKRLNPHDRQKFPAVTPAVVALQDLAQLADYSHVDLPQLIQGNVALQVFTVVTKVPMPLKLEGNGSGRDNITKLAILQRWPIGAWFSLKARALHQAQQLKTLEKRSSGQFRVIQTAADLTQYLQQRTTQPAIVAGLLGLAGAQALEGKIENLDRLYDAGFRLIGLAHFLIMKWRCAGLVTMREISPIGNCSKSRRRLA
jgi:membrane dipeptidase